MSNFILTQENNIGTKPTIICPICTTKSTINVEKHELFKRENHKFRVLNCTCDGCHDDFVIYEEYHSAEFDHNDIPSDTLLWVSPLEGTTPRISSRGVGLNTVYYKNIIDNQKLIDPDTSFNIQQPNKDMGKNALDLYNEATSIATKSPRAACALLRVCLETIMVEDLKLKDDSIYKMSAELYSRGIPEEVETAIHSIRFSGNKSDHYSTAYINLKDSEKYNDVIKIASLINFIVDDQITRKKNISHLKSLFTDKQKENIEKTHK